MINVKKFLNNVRKEYPKNELLENSFSSLSNMSDDGRRSRASNMTAFYEGISQGPDGQARTTWSVPSQSDSSTKYQAVVEIVVPTEGGLFSVSKGKWDPKKFANTLKEADVRVSCSCPDFWWGGQTYNLGSKGKHKGNLASGANSTDIAPDIRDPKREHVLCKHLISIFNVFPANSFKIMGDARKFDANIETDEKSSKDIEQGKAVLQKDKELFSIPSDGKKVITDALYKGAEELSKNQENEGAEELIDEKNESTLDSTDISDNTGEIIEDKNEATVDDTKMDSNVDEIIDERNEQVISQEEEPDNTDEIINDMNEKSDLSELEKDKSQYEDSEVSNDPNELLNRA